MRSEGILRQSQVPLVAHIVWCARGEDRLSPAGSFSGAACSGRAPLCAPCHGMLSPSLAHLCLAAPLPGLWAGGSAARDVLLGLLPSWQPPLPPGLQWDLSPQLG